MIAIVLRCRASRRWLRGCVYLPRVVLEYDLHRRDDPLGVDQYLRNTKFKGRISPKRSSLQRRPKPGGIDGVGVHRGGALAGIIIAVLQGLPNLADFNRGLKSGPARTTRSSTAPMPICCR